MRRRKARPALTLLALSLLLPPAWPQAEVRNLNNITTTVAAPAVQARRVALIIGNNKYPDAPLLNPVNDARAMARSLEAAGFQVILRTDANQREMLAALREFGTRLKDSAAGLFYYAGHGMQIKGRNFLIPVGADIQREDEVAYQALDAQAVLDKMESAGNGTNLMILDACRNNPFARSFRSGSQGLAQMDAPVGTMVAFSTAPGSVASDGQGSNGLYTQHLLSALQQPGLKVEEVFKQVRGAVRRESQGKQVPWESTSLEGDFYFVQPVPAMAMAPPPDPLAALDEALWATVKDSTHPSELQAYLLRFPQGLHAEAARGRVVALAPSPTPTVAIGWLPAAPAPLAAGPAALKMETAALAPITVAALAPALRVPTATALPVPTAPALQVPAAPALSSVDEANSTREQRALAESQRRIAEIVRWGDDNTDRRPAQPRRNASGFTEGDRYRYRVLDRWRNEFTGEFLRRVDRIEDSGEMVLNDGALRLDTDGNLLFANVGITGTHEQWAPGLQIADAAGQTPGYRRDIAGQREQRESDGSLSRIHYTGTLRVVGNERVTVPAGSFDAVRIEVKISGQAQNTGQPRRGGFSWHSAWEFSYWFVPSLGLPVAIDMSNRVDGTMDKRLRHELTAFDVAGSTQRMADLAAR